MPENTTHTIGRRKEAVCRLYIKPGSGKWSVNGRTLGDYFPRPAHVSAIQQPFTITDTLGRYDVKAKVEGGGLTGQAGALRLAVARALVKLDEAHRRKLRDLQLLTRDARAVERKKPGRRRQRKNSQFSKRNPRRNHFLMAQQTREQLLEAGAPSGHQTRRWNPKMRRFIFAERNGIH